MPMLLLILIISSTAQKFSFLPAGKALADSIQAELCKVTQASRTAKAADYFVLRRNKIPAVLVEVGYITNMEERLLL